METTSLETSKRIWEFIAVTNYEGYYEVSTAGEIYSVKRKQLVSRYMNKKGYMKANLNKDGIRKGVFVHRLVAQAFINNPNNYGQVNHIDGNKRNNAVDNLEWVNQSENMKHAYRIGIKTNYGSKNPRAKLTQKKVDEYRRRYLTGEPSRLLALEAGIHPRTMQRALNGSRWNDK